MLDLEQMNAKLASYFSDAKELETLHKALKKQNSHLIYFEDQGEGIKSYCEKHRLNPEMTLLCADVTSKKELYKYLYESHLRNYIFFQKDSADANYTHLNFLIYLQRKKLSFKSASFDEKNTFSVEEIEDLFREKNISAQVRKHFSIIYNELVMNAIIHGQTTSPQLSYTSFSDYLIFRIEDKRGLFQFDQLNKVFNSNQKEVNPESVRTAGIGLNMVFKYASGLAYEVIKDKSTVATFYLNLKRAQRDCSFIFCRYLSSQEQYLEEE